MKRAILITGFSSWGKSTHIFHLFNRQKYYWGKSYSIEGTATLFTVESHSNDDFNEEGYLKTISDRLAQSPPECTDLFSAFCPTREEKNDSRRILQSSPFTSFDEVHILMLRNKWDNHAELKCEEIQTYLSGIENVRFFVIEDSAGQSDAERTEARELQIVTYLQEIYDG